ncbi:MAG TPA: allophanate hydrolase [Cellulomonas sp.]
MTGAAGTGTGTAGTTGTTGTAGSAAARVRAALDRLAAVDHPEAWTVLRPAEDLLAEAAAIDAAVADGADLPLAGTVLGVKDNIDVAGLPTTDGFPGAARLPERDAVAVARLRAAGAVVLGKTQLDQFATGLVGTRVPGGPVRHATVLGRIAGGSSAGSAVAVALGVVDLALGTDTAGSGRVPAALHGIVGIKPTLGLVPVLGMSDACRPYDTVTVLARDLDLAVAGARTVAGPDPADGLSRTRPDDAPLAAPDRPVLAVPDDAVLDVLTPAARTAWAVARARAAEVADLRTVDVRPFLAAARLLYEGAIVAGRYAAAGATVTAATPAAAPLLDPTVRGIVEGAARPAAWEYVRDRKTLDGTAVLLRRTLDGCDALLLPTAPGHPTLAEVQADPVGVNAWMGTFTNFVNLLDLCGVAVPVPAPTAPGARAATDDERFGVTVLAPAFHDDVAVDLAARLLAVPAPRWQPGVPLLVVGAHLRGQPLHDELERLGARYVGPAETAARYRLHALATRPAKPGLVPVASGGAHVPGELYDLPVGGLGRLLAALPAPMTLGPVELADGRTVTGFGCAADALDGATDITAHGGWREHLAAGR